ncbi:aminotransferase class I/II-fold pyridoxal phosphate-dependent enzyme [Myxococcota bacterium]|nr:aminotransferase class I/II-fold pyridoxal phosphate-dependent enzyme [Myxococcota bacterium]
MRLSRLAATLKEPATLRLNAEAARLKAAGEAVIHLGGGEPAGPAPAAALEAARKVLDRGEVKYTATPGIPELRRAVARWTEDQYGRPVEPGHVLVSAGAKPVLMAALAAVVDPGDEVVVPAPYWVSYPEMVRMVGGTPMIVPAPEGEVIPRIPDLEKAVTSRTRAILCNSPNNPSGAVYPPDVVAGMLDLCRQRGLFLISDEIYRCLVFDGDRAVSPFSLWDGAMEDCPVILVDGVSKMFGMTGFRIGWAVASPAVIDAMNRYTGQVLSCASPLSQAATLAALKEEEAFIRNLREALERRRDRLVAELVKLPGLRIPIPRGTFYCLPDFSAFSRDSAALSEYLLEQARVVTVPGVDFGAEGRLRISFCGPEEDLVEGARRIRWALDPAAPPECEFGGKVHRRNRPVPGA